MKYELTTEQRARIIADWKVCRASIIVKDEVYGDKPANNMHHLFEQNEITKKLYPEYIHRSENIRLVNNNNHLNRPMPHLSELEFCQLFGIEQRSKVRGGL